MGGTDHPEGRAGVEFLDVSQGSARDAAASEEALAYGRRRRVRTRTGVLLLVLAAVAATGFWYLDRPAADHRLVVTYAGRPVDDPAGVIAAADRSFVGYTDDHYGARSAHARCYFDRVGRPGRNDVGPTLFCGPVLFFGGAAPATFLRYAIAPSGTAAHGRTRLAVRAQPVSIHPARLPPGARLERPDGRTAPSGADGLVAPPPPPTFLGALIAVRPADVPGLPHATAIIGTRDLQIAVRAGGVIPYYGRGDRARSAHQGEKLVAFGLDITEGDITGEFPGRVSLGLSVDGGPARPLPFPLDVYAIQSLALTVTRVVVAAVPDQARSVELVVADAGRTQHVSLLTGALGRDNIAVLARDGRDRYGSVRAARTALVSVDANGRRFTTRVTIEIDTPHLGYYSPYGRGHASGLDRALLDITVDLQSPRIACPGSSCAVMLAPRNLTLVPPDGRPTPAHDVGGGDPGFDVPSSFHRGTVTAAGSTKSALGWTVTLIHPLRVSISFPG